MTLNDLRRYAIRHDARVSFRLSNGMTCVVDTHGIARVAEGRGAADVNLETELAEASEVELETVTKQGSRRQKLARTEWAAVLGAKGAHGGEDDHEE